MATQVNLNEEGAVCEAQVASAVSATVTGTYYDLVSNADEEARYIPAIYYNNLDLSKVEIELYECIIATTTRTKLRGPIPVDYSNKAAGSGNLLLTCPYYLSAERKLEVRISAHVSGAAVSAGVRFACSSSKWTPAP
jgi:hypothetical protein